MRNKEEIWYWEESLRSVLRVLYGTSLSERMLQTTRFQKRYFSHTPTDNHVAYFTMYGIFYVLMCNIHSLSMLLEPPFAFKTALNLHGIDSTRFLSTDCIIQFLQIFQLLFHAANLLLSHPEDYSLGLTTGYCEAQWRTFSSSRNYFEMTFTFLYGTCRK